MTRLIEAARTARALWYRGLRSGELGSILFLVGAGLFITAIIGALLASNWLTVALCGAMLVVVGIQMIHSEDQ